MSVGMTMDSAAPQTGSYGEFRRGWPVVVSALLGIGLGLSPLPIFTLGAFAPHLHAAFGWSFGQIFFGITVIPPFVVVLSPVVGGLCDRFGVRLIALVSTVLFGLSFMGFAVSNGSLPLFYANWAVMSVCGIGTLPLSWTRPVNNRFEVRKGLALGLSLVGTGMFGYLAKPLVAWAIAHYGWRGAFVIVGALPILIAFPVGLLLFHDVGPARQTHSERRAHLELTRASLPGLTARQGFTDWRFWLIGIAILPIAFSLAGVIANVENILKLQGFKPATIVGLASMIGLALISGRAIGGWVLDRFWAPAVAVVLIGVPALGALILAQHAISPQLAGVGVCLSGFASGVEYDLMAFMVARYFGMKSYSLIYGGLMSFFSVGAGFGPSIFGYAFDRTHSYSGILTFAAAGMLIGALAMLALGRYRSFAAATAPIVSPATACPP